MPHEGFDSIVWRQVLFVTSRHRDILCFHCGFVQCIFSRYKKGFEGISLNLKYKREVVLFFFKSLRTVRFILAQSSSTSRSYIWMTWYFRIFNLCQWFKLLNLKIVWLVLGLCFVKGMWTSCIYWNQTWFLRKIPSQISSPCLKSLLMILLLQVSFTNLQKY